MKGKTFISYKNIETGYLYFFVHFVTEVCCFYALKQVFGNSFVNWIIPLIYDFLAFVTQEPIGAFCDRHRSFKPGILGAVILAVGLLMIPLFQPIFIPITFIAIGNAFIHVSGAEKTLRASCGKISHSAIFVAGGSFGIIFGKILGDMNVPSYAMAMAILATIPFMMCADCYKDETGDKDFSFANEKVSKAWVIVLAVLIVAVRGYMGYGIPTSWNKTMGQTILLYVMMGTGKALGGILTDAIGIRKTAVISIVGAVPFLVFGDRYMVISLIGVMMFSMTMAVTLALLASVTGGEFGVAFGLTTVGLFAGSLPVFFVTVSDFTVNVIIILVSSVLCLVPAWFICKPGERK